DQAPQDRGGQQQTERKQKRGPIALSQECFIHDAGHQPCFGNKQRAACHAERERRPELPFAARKPVQRAPAFLSNHAHQPRYFFLQTVNIPDDPSRKCACGTPSTSRFGTPARSAPSSPPRSS